jgi:MFS family permease
MAAQTMILEFGSREEIAMRIAISATAESITATLGPLAGGLMADHFGFHWVFGISIGFLVAALIILVTSVKEPRRIVRGRRS